MGTSGTANFLINRSKNLLFAALLLLPSCKLADPANTSTSSFSEPQRSEVALSLDNLLNLGLDREEALEYCDWPPLTSFCRDAFDLEQKALPLPVFDPAAVRKVVDDHFADFRLGQNDTSWFYSERCRVNKELVFARMANLRAYLSHRGFPAYALRLHILNIAEASTGAAVVTTQLRHQGRAVSEPENHHLVYETRSRGKWSSSNWKLADCEQREWAASLRCGSAFQDLRFLCLPLWENTMIEHHKCDLRSANFFVRLHHTITTSEEFSLNNPEQLKAMCDPEEVKRDPALPPSDSIEPSFAPFTVAASIIKSFDAFRLGSDSPWLAYSKPCRAEEWDEGSQRWVTRPEYAVAEIANLRAYFTDAGFEPTDLEIEVTDVQTSPTVIEVRTQILHEGTPVSPLTIQRLQFEEGALKSLNCDRRELKAAWLCGNAFGDQRGICLPLWLNFVKDQRCEINNQEFFAEFREVLSTSTEFHQRPLEFLEELCGLTPTHGDP